MTDRNEAFAAERVAGLPSRWQGRLLRAWERRRSTFDASDWSAGVYAQRDANLELLDLTEQLAGVRLPLDASDSELCGRAEQLAELCGERAQLFHEPEVLRAAMARVCVANGVQPPELLDPADPMPAIRRMTDPLWWRRQLRRLHAKAVEGAAIRLGLVNRTKDCYVSAESLRRRQQQNARNAAAMEATTARNELGQEFTLAELAAKGPSNKAIRRAELMTRIAGFERIARELGHAGLFLTITCPSRMHKWRTIAGGRVIENRRYDGTNPREAQAYLAKVWARIRASLKRQEVGIYGFRIAEPNHDGTPHWHLLLFHRAEQFDALTETVSRYALADSPGEPGAHRHRVDLKPIDWERGTAAGYIAKYVAKNIDGYKLDADLYGNPALETSARVEAWAATWGIRQFQQIGGPPVTVWRELRRVESIPEGAPDHLKAAHRAANKLAQIEGRDQASVAWDRYCKAQGGVFVGRGYLVRVAKAEREGLNRYGEPLQPSPIGVETVAREPYKIGRLTAQRVVHWVVESARHVWQIVSRTARRVVEGFKGPQAPWTRVINCTEGGPSGTSGRGAEGLGASSGAYSDDGGGLRWAPVGGAGGLAAAN